jgi:hypothetical protein
MTDSGFCSALYQLQEWLHFSNVSYAMVYGLPLVVVLLLARWTFGYQRDYLVRWGDLRWPLLLLIPTLFAQLARIVWFISCYSP